ncbi:uncharacterized protein [Lepisosteus oculatus]|uniref:uncharacterized protein isoform X2 n=1 Tax=Lepisosteus oculatus TaxID=7918 RepID=UPI00073FBE45|nr:PREDICTED: uncharacterized protein LOC107078852 isoform X2 [Lepisosteus oculatus]
MHLKWIRISVLIFALFLGRSRSSQIKAARLERWAKTGFQYLKLNLCQRVSSLSEPECKRLAQLPQTGVAVYASEPNSGEKVLAILPDSPSSKTGRPAMGMRSGTGFSKSEVHTDRIRYSNQSGAGFQGSKPGYGLGSGPEVAKRVPGLATELLPGSTAHDAVLALDPSPGESFGHPIILFYIDFNMSKKKCGHREGIHMGDECMTLALKSRCENLLKRRQSRSERQGTKGRARRSHLAAGPHSSRAKRMGGVCEVHFLPLVVGVKDLSRTQRLHCVEHRDFAPCPRPLPITSPSPSAASCELNKNTRRCHQQHLLTRQSCRVYQTCDHAILLSGGWQEQITYQRHMQNILHFYRMLRSNGFEKEHIKTFFAGDGQAAEKEAEGIYPATEKVAIRSYISYICRAIHCADSLVLYLNSPTRNDGTMLLWDVNKNGIADPKERYSVNELLSDLESCQARRVLLFVEQSYSTTLARKLRSSGKHSNVALLSGAPWGGTFSQFWGALHPGQCLVDHLRKVPSTPRMPETDLGLLNVTLSGAPCNATPPLTEAEMRKEYMGCQNLPTALWYQHLHRQGDKQD